jgi:hypothetical protein
MSDGMNDGCALITKGSISLLCVGNIRRATSLKQVLKYLWLSSKDSVTTNQGTESIPSKGIAEIDIATLDLYQELNER